MKNQKKWIEKIAACGFTLIELIVVVMIIGIIASLATPAFMKARDRSLVQAAHKEKMMADITDDRYTEPDSQEQKPVIREFTADWALQSDYQKVGLEVYSRYQLSAKGNVHFTRASNSPDGTTTLFIPFPKGTIEASNVYLRFTGTDGEAEEPSEAIYTTRGFIGPARSNPSPPSKRNSDSLLSEQRPSRSTFLPRTDCPMYRCHST